MKTLYSIYRDNQMSNTEWTFDAWIESTSFPMKIVMIAMMDQSSMTYGMFY